MNKPIFIIEHLEPELWPWCVIEYKHISETVGKDRVWFTNIQSKDVSKLEKYGQVSVKSVKTLVLDNVAVLDPESPELLTPENSKEIKYFIFGGILGDYPPKKRTKKELTKFIKNAKSYNIGKEQFSTDNAVLVTHLISQGSRFQDLKFQDKLEVKTGKYDSFILPYLYTLIDNKPFVSPELIKYLKKKKEF